MFQDTKKNWLCQTNALEHLNVSLVWEVCGVVGSVQFIGLSTVFIFWLFVIINIIIIIIDVISIINITILIVIIISFISLIISRTEYSMTAVPKNVGVEGNLVTWESPCSSLENEVGYTITILDTTTGKSSFTSLGNYIYIIHPCQILCWLVALTQNNWRAQHFCDISHDFEEGSLPLENLAYNKWR